MENPLRAYIQIAISLVLFSLLLSFIVYLSGTARDFLNIGVEQRSFNQELAEQRSLYAYNNRVILGDEVLLAVKKYTQVRNMRIEVGDVNSGLFYELGENDSDAVWDLNRVRVAMGPNIYEKYKGSLDRDSSGAIFRITFVRVTE